MKRSTLATLFATALVISCTAQESEMSEAAFAYFKQGQDLERQGELQEALQFFNKADSVQPGFMGILHARGLLRSHLGDYPGAVEDLDKAIQFCADAQQCEVYHGNRALVHMDAGKLDLACADWQLAGKSGRAYHKKHCK
ncbi:MAG: hypothetical protein KA408_09925 [Flavobacteriales bacterium]|nr:hypothetical protein [Flavobacteriales bacterium]